MVFCVRVSTANIWRSSYISSQIFFNSECQSIVVDHNAACIDTPFEDNPANLDVPVTLLLDFTPPQERCGGAKKRKGAPKSAPTGDKKEKKKKKMESEDELKASKGEEDWEPEGRSQ
jgi:hypothetical protein